MDARNEPRRKRRRDETSSRYLHGASRKVFKLREGVKVGATEVDDSPEQIVTVAPSSQCLSCAPVLDKLKGTFNSLVRRDKELRHSKLVLPQPRKPDKLHYRNLVAQNQWIRNNLFDALGNYRYCQKCITKVLGIGTQRLACQRVIRRREALIPIADMTKAEVATKRLVEFVVMPEGQDNFKLWWSSLDDTHIVQVRFPHTGHGLARKPSNSSKKSVQDDFLTFVDANSQPNGRNASSFGPQFYFLPKFSRIGAPKRGEGNSIKKAKQSVICEFNRSQTAR